MIKINSENLVNVNPRDLIPREDLEKLIGKSLVGINDKYEREKYILQIVADNNYYNDVCSLGNISTTVGAAKSRKTFFSTMMMSAMVSDNPEFGIKGFLYGKKILFVDTEQAPFHVQKIGKRIQKITEKTDNYDILYLRHCLDMDTRLAVLDYYLDKFGNNYTMVVIDGIVDLVNDYNNQAECRKIVSLIMAWSDIYNNHINCVIHTNKDKGAARGHLGAELINKSEVVFRATKTDKETTEIKCEESRNKEFDSFTFTINDHSLPERQYYPDGYYDNTPKKKNHEESKQQESPIEPNQGFKDDDPF